MKTNVHFTSYLNHFFLEYFRQNCRENHNTHFMSSNDFYKSSIVCEKMWKNIVERGRPHMAIRRMRIACWIPKATNTNTQ